MERLSLPADGGYADVVRLLKQLTPSFTSSPEYALVSGNNDLPGVVLAAYGRFLARLVKLNPRSNDLIQGLIVFHAFHGWSDIMVQTSIRDEFVESFDGDLDALRAIEPMLSSSLRAEFASVLGAQMSH